MTNEIFEYLEQLELTEGEAKLYLTLLKHGEMTVTALAKAAGVYRTAAYSPIERLVEKGLVMELVKGSRSLIAATQPEENLQLLVEQKMQKDKIIQEKLPDIIKTILKATPESKPTSEAEIRYYTGKLGIKKIYKEALKAKELRSYVNIEDVLEAFPENNQLFDDAFKRNPEMKMFEICEDSPEARERIKTSDKNHLYKILPTDMKLTGQDVLLYDNKVAVIHLKDKIHGVILYNTDLFRNFKLLFDFLWKMLP